MPLRRTNDARCALLVQLISRFKELAVQIKELQTVLFVLWQDLRVVHYLCCVSIISSSIVATGISASSLTKVPTIGRLSFDDLFFWTQKLTLEAEDKECESPPLGAIQLIIVLLEDLGGVVYIAIAFFSLGEFSSLSSRYWVNGIDRSGPTAFEGDFC